MRILVHILVSPDLNSMKRFFILLYILAYTASSTFSQATIMVKEAGTLEKDISLEMFDTCYSLKVMGKLNSTDIKVLRRMAGAQEADLPSGHLQLLDLTQAIFVNDKKPYLVLDAAKENMWGFAHAATMNISSPDTSIGYYSGTYSRYWPTYAIGCPPAADSIAVAGNEDHYSPVRNLSFNFSAPFKSDDRLRMKIYSMKKFKGHVVKRKGGTYQFVAFLRKDTFCKDMFYKCPNLKTVILSADRTLIRNNVYVYDDPITYKWVRDVKM